MELFGLPLWFVGLAVVVGGVVAAALFKTPRTAVVVLAAMLFVSALGVPDEEGLAEYRTFLLPIQQNRALLYAGLGALLALGVLVHFGKVRLQSLPVLGLAMLGLAFYLGLVHMYHDPNGGILTILLAALSIGPLILLLPMFLDARADFIFILRAIALLSLVWLGAVLFQFAISPSIVVIGGGRRFTGLLGNPQHAAAFCALVAAVGLWLSLNDTSRRYRPLWIGLTAVYLVFVGWTGSRTGALMTVVGLTAILYARAGRAIFLMPVFALALWAIIALFNTLGVEFGFERLISTEDTRSAAWAVLWRQSMDNFALGVGPGGAFFSENSFLIAFATFGVGGFIMVIFAALVSAIQGFRLLLARRFLPVGERTLADLTIGLIGMYWAGALFEGYGASRISAPLTFILVAACFATALLDRAALLRAVGWNPDEADLQANQQPLADDDGYEWYSQPAQPDPR